MLNTCLVAHPIISVANVPKPAEVRIKRVAGWDGLCLFVVGARAGSVAPLASKMCRFGERNVGWIGFPPVARGVGWLHNLFDVFVQPIQYQIGKNRTDYASYNVAKKKSC